MLITIAKSHRGFSSAKTITKKAENVPIHIHTTKSRKMQQNLDWQHLKSIAPY